MVDLAIARCTLADLLRPRRMIVTLLLVLLPAALALLARAVAPNPRAAGERYDMLAPLLIFGFILVILTVIHATGAIAQDVEQKTIVYLLTRPVARWRILLAKFAAVMLVIVGAIWASIALLAAVDYGPGHMLPRNVVRDFEIAPVGALAYGAAFLLVATLVRRPLLVGLAYAFGLETWASYVPGIQKLSLMFYLRVLSPHATIQADTQDVNSFVNQLTPTVVSVSAAWMVTLGVGAVGLLAALIMFSVREYVPREDTE